MTSERDQRAPDATLIQRLRAMPIGVKFAAAVVATMGLIALGIGFGLSRLATQQLVQGKLRGSGIVIDTIAETLAPALDFSDEAATTEIAERLARMKDVSRVIVWNQDSAQPVYRRPADAKSRAPARNQSRAEAAEIVLTRLLKNPVGQPVGSLEVALTLQPEARYSRYLRARILSLTGLLALIVTALIIVVARFAIVQRLKKLLSAMIQLRNGRQVELDASMGDEIGELAAGFNQMALAIRDREQKLSIERDKSHELLDNMRQAILVVSQGGGITDVRSRQAEIIFGDRLHDKKIWALLCDDSRPAIERDAVREWVETAFSLGPSHWNEMAKLAPTEAVVKGPENELHVLTMDVRPIILEGRLSSLMFLCTDVTAHRQLQKAARDREQEHDRQLRLMRSLMAGSGLQLVATIRSIEERLASCERILRSTNATPPAIDEAFQLVHSIKGDASAFELDKLAHTAAVLEAEVSNYRMEFQHGMTGASQALPFDQQLTHLARALGETRGMIAAASPLGDKILDLVAVRYSDWTALKAACADASEEMKNAVNRALAQYFGPLVQNLAPASQRWASRVSKKVALEITGHDVLVPDDLARVLPGVLTQLVRNSVSHGIETPEERAALGKPEVGRIQLVCTQLGAVVMIHVIDDGYGLPEARLAAQSPGDRPSEAAFQPGVTTADDAAIQAGIAGRGIGLASVRAELATVGYGVQLRSVPTRGVDARLYPLASEQREEPQ